jgi:SAM-dependent methyltransferase
VALVHIDQPAGGRFETPNPSLVGWFVSDTAVEGVVMRGLHTEIPFRRVSRPDVEAVYPGHTVFGFSCYLPAADLSRVEPLVRFELHGQMLADLGLSVTPEATSLVEALRNARAAKRRWCLDHARCPTCKHPQLRVLDSRIECRRCSAKYEQPGEAINFLSPELYRACSLDETPNVSMNGYDYTCWQIVHRATETGGKILDCGAGLRMVPSETVVNLEIIDVASTDVLGVGQSLPFLDGSFDGVFSLAVLEHVSDPFACAREIVRVLKPGGQIYCHVPFLQPEHGYPNHFYNMTREGLTNLFPDLVAVEHVVPDSGLPVFALHWMVSHYAAYLEEGAREKFLSMTMRELVARRPEEWGEDEIVKAMGEEGKWKLACTTALLMKKPS